MPNIEIVNLCTSDSDCETTDDDDRVLENIIRIHPECKTEPCERPVHLLTPESENSNPIEKNNNTSNNRSLVAQNVEDSDDSMDELLKQANYKQEPVTDYRCEEPHASKNDDNSRGRALRILQREKRKSQLHHSVCDESDSEDEARKNRKLIRDYEKEVAKSCGTKRRNDSHNDRSYSSSEDFDEKPTAMEKKRLLRKKKSTTKKRLKNNSLMVIDLTEEENKKVEVSEKDVGDYERGMPFMRKEFLDTEKVRKILRHINTASIDSIIKHIEIDVRAVKFAGEDAVQVKGFGNIPKEEQQIAFVLKFHTKLTSFTKRFPIPMDNLLHGNGIFNVGNFLANVNRILTDPGHPSSIRNIFAVPMAPQYVPCNLRQMGSLEAGKSTFGYFQNNLFGVLESMKTRDRFEITADLKISSKIKDNFQQTETIDSKNDTKNIQRKKILRTRFNMNPDINDEDETCFRNSARHVAKIILSCEGDGLGCHTRCGMRVGDANHLDFDKNGNCPHCSVNVATLKPTDKKCHYRCGFKVYLFMFSNRLNEWQVFVDIDNEKFHPDDVYDVGSKKTGHEKIKDHFIYKSRNLNPSQD